MSKRILLLGGTQEARLLGNKLAPIKDFHTILSLAGVTRQPLDQGLIPRIGGFGGADGLADFLREETIDAVIDATHPFAKQMSENAFRACSICTIPLMRFGRPAWRPSSNHKWQSARDNHHAASLLAPQSRILLAVGRGSFADFVSRADCWFLSRSIEVPDTMAILPNGQHLKAWPGASVDEEVSLLKQHRIDCLVTKNSGGSRGFHKVEAACRMDLPIVMIERPTLPSCPNTWHIDDVLLWINAL